MEYLILAVIIGAIAGALRVILGYLKHDEIFDKSKAIRTLCIAIIEGGLIGVFYPISDLKTLFAVVFAGTVTLEELLKAVLRRF